MSTLRLEVAGEGDAELWDRLVSSSPHGSVFHRWEWLRIAEKYSKTKLYPLIAYKGTTPVAAFPVFVRKFGLFSAVFSPPPRLAIPFLGPVIAEYGSLKQNKRETICQGLVEGFASLLREWRAAYVSVTTPPELVDVRQFLWQGFKAKPMYNYFFDLSRGRDYLWGRLKKARRKNITKTGRKFEFRAGGSEDFEFVISGVFSRAAEQNIKLRLSREYLREVYRRMNGCIDVHVVSRDGENVVGLINLTHGSSVYSWLGNFKRHIKGYSPNDLLLWSSVEHYISRGYTRFFEIGANTQRLVRFKSQFNPELVLNFELSKTNPVVEAGVNLVRGMKIW